MKVPPLEQEEEKLVTIPGVSWQQFKTSTAGRKSKVKSQKTKFYFI